MRWDAITRAASANEDYRNESHTYGRMVEIDPFAPGSTPVKRTHLDRFAHEGVVFAPVVEGAPVECCSGDTARFEYIDNFVSDGVWVLVETDGSILDTGTLYAAKFNDGGTGEWLALAPGRNGLTPANGFACPDGLWCDADSRLWIQTDMGDLGPDYEGPLKDFEMNGILAAAPTTGENKRFLTGPRRQATTGVVSTPDGKTMFVHFQRPSAHASTKQFGAGDFGSGFPDYEGTVPRSATVVIAKHDGGFIGT